MKTIKQLQAAAQQTNAELYALEAAFSKWHKERSPKLSAEQRGLELDEWIVNLGEARFKQAKTARELAAAITTKSK